MRARGKPTYTQRSVAFPGLAGAHGAEDDINVEFAAKGGEGVYGSGVTFTYYEYGIRVSGFDDGFANLMDDRIQRVIVAMHKNYLRMRRDRPWGNRPATSPEQLIALLEAEGIEPSSYQIAGKRR